MPNAPSAARALELRVARARDDGLCAGGRREDQAERRHAARAFEQHVVAGLQPAVLEEADPRGDARRRQRRGFLVREMLRDRDEALLVGHDHLGQHAARVAAAGRVEPFLGAVAVDPAFHEDARHAIAHLETRDVRAERDHLARAVGERDAARQVSALAGPTVAHVDVVAAVDRGRVDRHEHLVRARLRSRHLLQHHLVRHAVRARRILVLADVVLCAAAASGAAHASSARLRMLIEQTGDEHGALRAAWWERADHRTIFAAQRAGCPPPNAPVICAREPSAAPARERPVSGTTRHACGTRGRRGRRRAAADCRGIIGLRLPGGLARRLL